MLQKLLSTLLLAVITTASFSQDIASGDATFSYESFTLGQITLPYRKASIELNNTTKPALVLYLHGGTSRGNDNETQLKEKAVGVITDYLTRRNIPAIFIVPQCPANGGWTSQNRKVMNDLLQSYILKGEADADRVYVMGGSMGGTGTWCQLSYFPNFYAAAMPVAGNPTGLNATNVATTPVLTVMGTADALMSIDDVETFKTDVIAAGGTVLLNIENGWSHPTTCEESYTDERLDWLFSHTRSTTTGIRDISKEKVANDVKYSLSGRHLSSPTRSIYIRNGKKYR